VRASSDGKGQVVGLVRYQYSTDLLDAIHLDILTLRKYVDRLRDRLINAFGCAEMAG
jgi:hypothetical protein